MDHLRPGVRLISYDRLLVERESVLRPLLSTIETSHPLAPLVELIEEPGRHCLDVGKVPDSLREEALELDRSLHVSAG